MNIPSLLKSNVQEGKAVLMLGAGASATATNDKGEKAPCGKELSKLLSEQFLDGNFADYPLNRDLLGTDPILRKASGINNRVRPYYLSCCLLNVFTLAQELITRLRLFEIFAEKVLRIYPPRFVSTDRRRQPHFEYGFGQQPVKG